MAAMMTAIGLNSCDSAIYDAEGDCSVTYRLKFRYDMNMKWADAFAHEVKSVKVYVYDSNGHLVTTLRDAGEHLAAEDYSMPINLAPGDYHLIAWCGLENDGERAESFAMQGGADSGEHYEKLFCRMNRKIDEADKHYVDERLYDLYHGTLDITVLDEDDPKAVPGKYFFTMKLMKDTNHVRVVLQHLSGMDLDSKDFSFRIEDNNGYLYHDNSLVEDPVITYHEWNKHNGLAGVVTNEDNWHDSETNMTKVQTAVADLTVSRLMTDHPCYLTIRNLRKDENGNPLDTPELQSAGDKNNQPGTGSRLTGTNIVARIPLTEYALLTKSNYLEPMGDQEFLDRQDEYNLVFFLDENRTWSGVSVIINSWRVVKHEYKPGS